MVCAVGPDVSFGIFRLLLGLISFSIRGSSLELAHSKILLLHSSFCFADVAEMWSRVVYLISSFRVCAALDAFGDCGSPLIHIARLGLFFLVACQMHCLFCHCHSLSSTHGYTVLLS